jgi:hypothetical protein
MAARYGLDGSAIEYRLGWIFRTRPDGSWVPPASHKMGTGLFPEGKAFGV